VDIVPRPEEHLSPDRPLGDDEAERLAERMVAFAAASRLKLLYALVAGECSVDELAARAGLTPNAVSQQLRVLRHLRLVATRRDGRRVLYRLHDHHLVDLLGAIRHQLEHAEQGWAERPAATPLQDADVAPRP
jgi:DNA-binding transcriptional ArsR family regulator